MEVALRVYSVVQLWVLFVPSVKSVGEHFEDSRCQCTCPDPSVLYNNTGAEDRLRRVYTNKTNPSQCQAWYLIGSYNIAVKIKSEPEGDKLFKQFIERCNCDYQTRNTTLLKVVISLVICIISILICYMLFLVILDPMLRSRRGIVRYEQHTNEDENIFAGSSSVNNSNGITEERSEAAEVRARNSTAGVLDRVEHEQNKWRKKVEEQRKNIFTDHTMLN